MLLIPPIIVELPHIYILLSINYIPYLIKRKL